MIKKSKKYPILTLKKRNKFLINMCLIKKNHIKELLEEYKEKSINDDFNELVLYCKDLNRFDQVSFQSTENNNYFYVEKFYKGKLVYQRICENKNKLPSFNVGFKK